MKLSLVAAVAENRVIGVDGELPWHYPEDLKRFKATTMGHPVIMGRRTFEAIEQRLDGPLPGRTNIVLSRRQSLDLPDGAMHARSVEDAREAAAAALDDGQETVYVIGGSAVYEAFFEYADELLITEIPESPSGDTRFPEIGGDWQIVDQTDGDTVSFVTYHRDTT